MQVYDGRFHWRVWLVIKKVSYQYRASDPVICFFFSLSNLYYLPTVGLDGYCCTWSEAITHAHTHTHTHTNTLGRTHLDERSARRKCFYLYNTQQSQETNTHPRRDSKPQSQRAAVDRAAIIYFMINNIRFIVVLVIWSVYVLTYIHSFCIFLQRCWLSYFCVFLRGESLISEPPNGHLQNERMFTRWIWRRLLTEHT